MKYIETLSVLFSVVSVVLAMRKNVQTWTIGILGILGYMIIFWSEKLYADFALQFIFIAQSIWGYYSWKNNRSVEIKRIETIPLVTIALSLFISLIYVFRHYTDNPFPILDSLASTLSILAVYLLSLKVRFSWKVWMAADLVYILLFFQTGLLLSCSLYTLFFFLAWGGYKSWNDEEA